MNRKGIRNLFGIALLVGACSTGMAQVRASSSYFASVEGWVGDT